MDKLVVLDLLELLDPQVLLDRMAKEDNLVLLDQADLVDQLVQEAGMERLVPPEVVDRLVPWEALATQDHRVHAAPTELQVREKDPCCSFEITRLRNDPNYIL